MTQKILKIDNNYINENYVKTVRRLGFHLRQMVIIGKRNLRFCSYFLNLLFSSANLTSNDSIFHIY